MVGPTRVSPKKSARSGTPARANSSASTTASMVLSPLPPYSWGQVAQIQPPWNSRWFQSSLNWRRCSAVIVAAVSFHAAGRLSASQARISERNASASGG